MQYLAGNNAIKKFHLCVSKIKQRSENVSPSCHLNQAN